jgi:hypothetical protein
MGSQRVWMLFRAAILVGVTVAVVFGAAGAVTAQALKDVRTPDTPLVLKAQGSFFVGGEKVEQNQSELGNLGLGGRSPSTRCTCASWCRRAVTAISQS